MFVHTFLFLALSAMDVASQEPPTEHPTVPSHPHHRVHATAEGPGAHHGNSSLPFPESQGRDKFKAFMKNCHDFLTGNNTSPVSPSTYFSKMPDEWLNATNTSIAACAKKYDANFASLSAADVKGFYTELCPPLPPFMTDPAIRQHMEEAKAMMQQVKAVCQNVKANTLTGLPAPNSVFTKSPDFDKMLTHLQHAQKAKAALNATSQQGNGTDHHLKGKHRGGKKGNPLVRVLANVTGTAIPDRKTASPEEMVAFSKSMFNRLLSQPWTDAQTTAFWQALCTKGGHHGHGRHNGTQTDGITPTPNANIASGAQSVVAGSAIIAVSFVLSSLLWI